MVKKLKSVELFLDLSLTPAIAVDVVRVEETERENNISHNLRIKEKING